MSNGFRLKHKNVLSRAEIHTDRCSTAIMSVGTRPMIIQDAHHMAAFTRVPLDSQDITAVIFNSG